MAKLSPSEIAKTAKFAEKAPKVFTRGVRMLEAQNQVLPPPEKESPELLKSAKYLEDCFPPEKFEDCQPDGEPLHHFERLAAFKARHPYFEDRSTKPTFVSARCPFWLKEDFDFICRAVEGEDPAVVLRRLVRDYIRHNTPV